MGNSRGSRCHRYLHNDHHDHSIHAEWMGRVCRRLSRDNWVTLPFLMKDVVLLAVSIYLLKQDIVRVLRAAPVSTPSLAIHGG